MIGVRKLPDAVKLLVSAVRLPLTRRHNTLASRRHSTSFINLWNVPFMYGPETKTLAIEGLLSSSEG
jgi:hypothetical protein